MPFQTTILFSIIIPTFNAGKDIAQAIQSVLRQDFTDFEILLMDGGSIDGTVEIVRSIADDRIRIFSEKDTGIYDAMNKGISQSAGEWLFFLGSDDELFDHQVLSDTHSFISSRPAFHLFYGDAQFKHSGEKHGGEFTLQRLLYENNICHQAIFYNRMIFEKIGRYNLSYFLYADWDLNIRCFMHPGFVNLYINRTISLYNELEGISARRLNADTDFVQIIPALQLPIQLNTQRLALVSSAEHRVGKQLLRPYRWLKKVLGAFV